MSAIKKLAQQTATYGFSTILGRLLNYSLVPLHLRIFQPQEYGVVSDIYAYVAFMGVLLTYGMETAYFRFSRTEGDAEKVYSTTYISHLISSVGFLTLFLVFAQPIAGFLKYPAHVEYVIWFAFIVVFDALTAIPLARLRKENRAGRFVFIRLSNISINVVFNLLFLLLFPYLVQQGITIPLYNPAIGVGYVFIANLIASAFTLVLLLPQLKKVHFSFDKALWKKMINYAWPILLMGFAGMVNEVFDRILLKYLLPTSDVGKQYLVGIYGACYKISIFMTLFVQMFRFAAEPFFFAQAEDKNSHKVYADVMKYFVLAGGLIFLGVMLYIDLVKYLLIGNPVYYPGLVIVPWLLLGNLFLGMYFNYSFWFKLTDKTTAGATIAILGAAVTLLLNWLLIPFMGYLGSAIATTICYAFMMLLCYFWGRKRFPVPYDHGRILLYLSMAVGFYLISLQTGFDGVLYYTVNTCLLFLYVGIAYVLERPKKIKSI